MRDKILEFLSDSFSNGYINLPRLDLKNDAGTPAFVGKHSGNASLGTYRARGLSGGYARC